MREILRVTWTVTPLQLPQPWRHCRHCNTSRKFACSGKFRVNAQKKRIDIWLIYRCEDCEESWNLPIYERALLAQIAELGFTAFMQNDETLVGHYAFDLMRLRRNCARIETSGELCVVKHSQEAPTRMPEQIEIALVMRHACRFRLEQLLSRELKLSRGLIARLAAKGALTVLPQTRKGVRSMIADGQVVAIDMGRARHAARDSLAQAVLAGRFSGVTLSDVT